MEGIDGGRSFALVVADPGPYDVGVGDLGYNLWSTKDTSSSTQYWSSI